MANHALRVPESQMVSAMKAESYFREHQARGDLTAFDTWLAASPAVAPIAADELPD